MPAPAPQSRPGARRTALLRTWTTFVCVVAGAAATLAACGGGGSSAGPAASAGDSPLEVAQALMRAQWGGDYDGACALMTSEARALFARSYGSCEKAVEEAVKVVRDAMGGKLPEVTFGAVSVNGDIATVELRILGTTSQVRLRRVDGRWLAEANA